MMVGNNLKEVQLQQIVDKTILQFDKDGDGKISFQEFCDVSCSLTSYTFMSVVICKNVSAAVANFLSPLVHACRHFA